MIRSKGDKRPELYYLLENIKCIDFNRVGNQLVLDIYAKKLEKASISYKLRKIRDDIRSSLFFSDLFVGLRIVVEEGNIMTLVSFNQM